VRGIGVSLHPRGGRVQRLIALVDRANCRSRATSSPVNGRVCGGALSPPSTKNDEVHLSDQAITDVINHVVTLDKRAQKGRPFTGADVAAVRAGGRKGGGDVAVERAKSVQQGPDPLDQAEKLGVETCIKPIGGLPAWLLP
jgi:hypothetical protein